MPLKRSPSGIRSIILSIIINIIMVSGSGIGYYNNNSNMVTLWIYNDLNTREEMVNPPASHYAYT